MARKDKRSPSPGDAGRGYSRRLALSYALLTLAVALALVLGIIAIYQVKLESQSRRVYRLLAEAIASSARSEVILPARSACLEVTARFLSEAPDFFSLFDSPDKNAVKIEQTYRFLRNQVDGKADILESVSIRYVNAGITLSSREGLTMEKAFQWPGDGWIMNENLTLFRTFPYSVPKEEARAVVAVSLRPTRLAEILGELIPAESGGIWLLDGQGIPAAGLPDPTLPRQDPAWWLEAAGLSTGTVATAANRDISEGGETFQVRLLPVDEGGLSILEVMPLVKIMRERDRANWQIVMILLVVVSLALIASVHLARIFNKPLQKLYRELDTYRPVILGDLAARLLAADAPPGDETLEMARQAGILLTQGSWRAFCLRWYSENQRDGKNPVPIRYLLSESLAELFGKQSMSVYREEGWIAGLLPEETREKTEEELFHSWIQEQSRLYGIRIGVGLGDSAQTDSGFARSLKQAENRARWLYFAAKSALFLQEPREGNTVSVKETDGRWSPRIILEEWAEDLRRKDAFKIEETMRFLREDAVNSGESWETLMGLLMGLKEKTSAWRESLWLPELQEPARGLPSAENCPGSEYFLEELKKTVFQAFSSLEERLDQRQTLIIAQVREFVLRNLGKDISLDLTAESVGLSPAYLSHLFGKITGESFVDFVNRSRTREAARLLEETAMTVRNIGECVGFMNPAYFTHRFKTEFGQSPREYRLSRSQKIYEQG